MTENFDKEIFAKIHSLKLLAENFLKIYDFICEFVTILLLGLQEQGMWAHDFSIFLNS